MDRRAVFVKGTTDSEGRLRINLDLGFGTWRVKVEKIIIQVAADTPPSPHQMRVIGCSLEFKVKERCANQMLPFRQALAICPVLGELNEYLTVAGCGSEEFQLGYCATDLVLHLQDEMSEAACGNTNVVAHFIIIGRHEVVRVLN